MGPLRDINLTQTERADTCFVAATVLLMFFS